MNSDKLQDAIGEIKDEYIDDAEKAKPHRSPRKIAWISVACAVAAATIILILVNTKGNSSSYNNVGMSYALACANYPKAAKKISGEDPVNGWASGNYEKLNAEWKDFRVEQILAGRGLTEKMNEIYSKFISETNGKANGENIIISPVNIYMALAMTAEITGGESRDEILRVLEADSIETVRDTASKLWRANYVDNGELVTIMANSIWTQTGTPVSKETLNNLVSSYYADIYSGSFTDKKYISSLKEWLNAKTGGQLKDAVEGLEIDPRTIMVLASTLYFRGKWNLECSFNKTLNEKGTFYGSKGKTNVTFMKKKEWSSSYYYFDHFSAVCLSFSGEDNMWFIRPDEGYTPEDIAVEEDLKLLFSGDYNKIESHCAYSKIDLWLPKFDISSDLDLVDTLREMGITKIFDCSEADFSPLWTEETDASITSIKHASRVSIDEDGCTATSFISETLCGAGLPTDKVEFRLDHPFMFAITSPIGGILFTGTVNNI